MKKLLLTLMTVLASVTANAWTVTFTNPDNWDKVNIWAWGENYSVFKNFEKWPGQAMTKNEDGTWTYTQTSGNPTGILFNNGGDDNNKLQTADYTFVDGEKYEITTPEILYIIGKVGGCDWNATEGIPSPVSHSGIYVFEKITVNESFAFTHQLADNNDDGGWSYLNAMRYGPSENNTKVSVGNNYDMAYPIDATWNIDNGTYTFTVDTKNKKFTISDPSDFGSTPGTGEGEGNNEEPWTVTYTNPENWERVSIYAYSNDGKDEITKAWPGDLMTYKDGMWSYTSSKAKPEIVIFNDGKYSEIESDKIESSDQTDDLQFSDGPAFTAPSRNANLTKITVYFDNSISNWDKVICYYYGDKISGKSEEMTAVKGKDGIYVTNAIAEGAHGLFYNGIWGSNNQTVNVSVLQDNHVYVAKETSSKEDDEGKRLCEDGGEYSDSYTPAGSGNTGESGNTGGDTGNEGKLFVIGTLEAGIWKPNIGTELTYQNGKYTGEVSLVGDCQFSFTTQLADDWDHVGTRYRPLDNTKVESGEKVQIPDNKDVDKSWFVESPGIYKFEVSLNPMEFTVTLTDKEQEVAIPESLTFIGQFYPEQDWEVGKTMTREGNKFSISDVRLIGINTSTDAYFAFKSSEFEYGALNEEKTASLTEPNEFGISGKRYFLPNGTYSFTVDFNTNSFTVSGTPDEIAGGDTKVYTIYYDDTKTGYHSQGTTGVFAYATLNGTEYFDQWPGKKMDVVEDTTIEPIETVALAYSNGIATIADTDVPTLFSIQVPQGYTVIFNAGGDQSDHNKTEAITNYEHGDVFQATSVDGQPDTFEKIGTKADSSNPSTGWTVYYTNPENWDNVSIYAFIPGEGENAPVTEVTASWPGDAMTKGAGNLWSYTSTSVQPTYVIFNDGVKDTNVQTGNLAFVNGQTYDMYGKEGDTSNNWTVTYTNPAGWSQPYAYSYGGDGGECFGKWPGSPMTQNGTNWIITGKGPYPEQIIFNNNEGWQTDDLEFTAGATYNDQPHQVSNGDDSQYPASLYIIGNVNNYSWNPMEGISTTGSNGVYTFTNITIADDNNGEGYFAFATKLGSDKDDWDTLNANRYGPADESATSQNSIAISVGTPMPMQFGKDASWSISAGVYTFTVSLVNNTVTVSKGSDSNLPSDPGDVTLYIVGSDINGNELWTASDENEMKYANGVYTWTGTRLGKIFKFNNGEWDTGYNLGCGEEDHTIVLDKSYQLYNSNEDGGSPNFQVEADTYIANPTVVLNLTANTVTVTGTSISTADYVPEVIYLKGSFDDWEEGLKLEKNPSTGLYEGDIDILTPESGDLEIKLLADVNNWYGPSSDEANVSVSKDSSATVTIVAESEGNWVISNWQEAKLGVSVNWPQKTMTLTVAPASINNLGQDEEVEEVIFNLQGVRVDRNKLTKGIYIINSKKVMIK